MRRWSLRSRLFVLIVLPLVVVAALAAIVRFFMAERISARLYDNTLLAVALTISRDVVLSEGDMLAEQLLDRLTNSLGDPVYYRIVGPGGRFVTGYSTAPEKQPGIVIERGIPAFYDSEVLGEPVRVVRLEEFISEPQFGGWVTVEVWQTVTERERLSLLLVYQSIAIMGVVILAAALLVWYGIRIGLRPLTNLEDAVRQRSPDDLRPIRRAIPEEIHSLVASMNALFTRLQQAFAERDAFIADAAHQLRNPVAAIQAQAESLATAPSENEMRRRVSVLSDTARHVSRLTQQLLTLERLRIGLQGRRHAPLDLQEMATNVIAHAAARPHEPEVRFEYAVSGTPYTAEGDPVLIEEALHNLVDNAVRYGCTDGGRVCLSIDFAATGVTIAVADDGPGIPAGMHERVFDRFFRGAQQGQDGSGLGLPIARSIAEAHGGSLELDHVARGTRLVLHLPRTA
ncbi:sensor histidine kinase [Limibaculum sp. M0105]|uniref:histidine kinase n=1 Tax=Thermohalobaculum xanthum TaxID=2753746 RepID=A0A8J7M8D8_9RHOB|nr:sensor histidine kinase [Thermohalobaculum xanthum]MBK0399573.1 sensor histidine kinase [Thermohalobaculum xanthum]